MNEPTFDTSHYTPPFDTSSYEYTHNDDINSEENIMGEMISAAKDPNFFFFMNGKAVNVKNIEGFQLSVALRNSVALKDRDAGIMELQISFKQEVYLEMEVSYRSADGNIEKFMVTSAEPLNQSEQILPIVQNGTIYSGLAEKLSSGNVNRITKRMNKLLSQQNAIAHVEHLLESAGSHIVNTSILSDSNTESLNSSDLDKALTQRKDEKVASIQRLESYLQDGNSQSSLTWEELLASDLADKEAILASVPSAVDSCVLFYL